METSNVIALGALTIAIGSLIFTWRSHVLARGAEKRAIMAELRASASEIRAIEAAEKAEKQERRGLWNRPIEALGQLVTKHGLEKETPDLIAQARIALMFLCDNLSEEDYPGIGDYLGITHGITAMHYERSIDAMAGEAKSVDVLSRAHAPVAQWLSTSISNLRLLQNSEIDDDMRSKLAESLSNYQDIFREMSGRSFIATAQWNEEK